jgi:NAD+ diphosphatase
MFSSGLSSSVFSTSGFSSLALTQTLPFLPLAQGDIDYDTTRRDEPGLIQALLRGPESSATSVMLVRDGKVAVPHGQGRLGGYDVARMRLAELPGRYILGDLAAHPEIIAIYLGAYGSEASAADTRLANTRRHAIALDLTRMFDGSQGLSHSIAPDAAHEGADDAFDPDNGLDGRAAKPSASLLEQAADRFDWVDLRAFVPHASARESGQATNASALSLWHARQRFCPSCGAAVQPAMGGWAQRCDNEADGNRTLFPRVEPAVITAIVDAQDRLLLQHNKAWGDSRLFSVSAGFVEAGENLEHACRREAKEEVGVDVGEVRYLGSQPWPFPSSLMVAFKARAASTAITVDDIETAEARWLTRDEYTAELATGRMQAPGKATIARYMIEEWYGREL